MNDLINKLNNIEQSLWEQEIRKRTSSFDFTDIVNIFDVYKKDSWIPYNEKNWDEDIKTTFIFQMIYIFVLNEVMYKSDLEIESLTTSGSKLQKEIANVKEVKFKKPYENSPSNDKYDITEDIYFLNHNFIYDEWKQQKNFFKLDKNEFQLLNIESTGKITPLWTLWITWIFIISSISALAIWIYFRKDFK